MFILTVSGSQLEVLKTIGLKEPIHLYAVHRETGIEEDLVYKSARVLEESRLIEKSTGLGNGGTIPYEITDIGACVLFGEHSVETERLHKNPMFSGPLTRLHSDRFPSKVREECLAELRRFARRFSMFSPDPENKDIASIDGFTTQLAKLSKHINDLYHVEDRLASYLNSKKEEGWGL